MSWEVFVFAMVLGATGLMRLIEVAVSVRRMKRRPGAVVAEPRLFPVMALLHIGLVVAPLVEVVWLQRPFIPALGGVGLLILLGATGLRVWTLRSIGSAWNVRVVRPADTAISTRGPYRWIRHPNYLCVVLEGAALPLLHTAWISAVVLSLVNGGVLYVRIRNEEAMLMQFDAWRAAFADRARLIPGVL